MIQQKAPKARAGQQRIAGANDGFNIQQSSIPPQEALSMRITIFSVLSWYTLDSASVLM